MGGAQCSKARHASMQHGAGGVVRLQSDAAAVRRRTALPAGGPPPTVEAVLVGLGGDPIVSRLAGQLPGELTNLHVREGQACASAHTSGGHNGPRPGAAGRAASGSSYGGRRQQLCGPAGAAPALRPSSARSLQPHSCASCSCSPARRLALPEAASSLKVSVANPVKPSLGQASDGI